MSNKIPRQFNTITCKMLVNTNVDIIGDVIHVFKDDSGYHARNTRTGVTSHMFLSMLRNENVLEVIEIN